MKRKTLDLSLYLVLDPDLCGGPEGMVRTARLAAASGATVVQLRAPGWKKRQWLETAIALKAALRPFGVPLIVNDHVDVALAMDADGVHVGQEDLPPAEARRLIGPDKILGLSVSSAAHLAGVPDGVDYLGVGPVYPTGTKPDAAPVLGVAALAGRVASARLPVVAIGGIRGDNCAALFAAGARGVAVVSAICGQPDPAAATLALRGTIDEFLPSC
ncbi:MAG: thiamine phosphate synthase [Candidatus Accumulibacter sp.]|jgi:thiamine-phosphate pyrophosphorylase|nr:thiamine phosphate synthase [Accumulibacter sp.]